MCQRLEITGAERRERYGRVRFFNHAWDDPTALREVGTLHADEVRELTGGLFAMDVPVEVNRLLFEYDRVIIVGPVFPHEVVGFSGGNKYLFPGVGGPRILNFFHWLGAVITTPRIIGNKWTPVRKVVDRAGALVRVPKLCFAWWWSEGRVGGAVCRDARVRVGRRQRSVPSGAHRVQGGPVPDDSGVRAGDV